MLKKAYTEEQIAFVPKQAETVTRVDEISRKLGDSVAKFYKWGQKHGGLRT